MRMIALVLLCWMPLGAIAEDYPLQAGDKVYAMPYGEGQTLPLWTHVPENLARDAPVFVVMHGNSRDADRYLHQWRDLADEYGFFLLVPEFSRDQFPKSRQYNLGNVRTNSGSPMPKEAWSFTRVEEAFDYFRQQVGITTPRYVLYGHSAGAQFVHRFMYYMVDARVQQYIAANAGWYTMPDFSENWPYGLRRTPVTRPDLQRVLSKPLLILLGDQDVDTNHESLRKTREAMRQGQHRLARGATFYKVGEGQAEHLQAPFGWSLAVVQGVAHDNRGMALGATGYLLIKPEQSD